MVMGGGGDWRVRGEVRPLGLMAFSVGEEARSAFAEEAEGNPLARELPEGLEVGEGDEATAAGGMGAARLGATGIGGVLRTGALPLRSPVVPARGVEDGRWPDLGAPAMGTLGPIFPEPGGVPALVLGPPGATFGLGGG